MTPENELRELRDTLAIEITRACFEKMLLHPLSTRKDRMFPAVLESDVLPNIYRMVDAVLSGRDRNVLNPPITVQQCHPEA
jgi:hypothetical protein